MRFTSLFVLSSILASVSAIAIPKHLGKHVEQAAEHILSSLEGRFDAQDPSQLERRTTKSAFFHTGDSSSSDSSSNPSHSQGNRTPSPQGSNSGSSLGIGRIPSPEHRPSSNQQQTKIAFSDAARKHLDDLGLHGKDRKQVKKEHVNRIKQEMKTNGATHATVERLAHSQGSVDPNVHITASFQKAKPAANGGVHKEPIPSTWKDHATGETVTGTNHHVYTNMEDKTKGKEAMPIHHPTYDRTLKNKAADGVAKYRRRSMATEYDY